MEIDYNEFRKKDFASYSYFDEDIYRQHKIINILVWIIIFMNAVTLIINISK